MPVRRKIPFREGIYFITFTCFQWMHLIRLTHGYDLVYQWFDKLYSLGHYVCGYVIMPNHIHLLTGFRNSPLSINSIVGNGKRYLGYQIIDRLEQNNELELLTKLQKGVSAGDRKRGKLHEIWQPSFDWKECDSEHILIQKLDYIHANPCTGKWNLADSPVDYIHSSAGFYLGMEHPEYRITHYQELDDFDLTKENR